MRLKHLLPVILLALAAISLFSQSQSQTGSQDQTKASRPATPSNKRLPAAAHDPQQEDEGERVFQQNCSRCHNAPDSFSSRISGTIVRHMRVRASLSQHDEEELLRFLNP
jgi:cytochrome c5